MPTVSTKDRATPQGQDQNDLEAASKSDGRVALARRRIAEGYYDRPEVRRTVAALLLKSLAAPRR